MLKMNLWIFFSLCMASSLFAVGEGNIPMDSQDSLSECAADPVQLLAKSCPVHEGSNLCAVHPQQLASNCCAPRPPQCTCCKPVRCTCKPCKPVCCCPKKECPTYCPPIMYPGYNQAARFDVNHCWSVFFDGSFLYWMAMEGGLDLIAVEDTVPSDPVHVSLAQMKYKYKPGFKAGIGLNFDTDDWDGWVEYTNFHSHTNRRISVGSSPSLIIIPVISTGGVAPNFAYTFVNEKWALKLNIGEAAVSRWYYVGQNLVFNTSFGGRGAWISQKLRFHLENPNGSILGSNITPPGTISNFTYSSSSWGAGPEVGLNTEWNMGGGFRLFGNGELDILFTRYNRRAHLNSNMIVVSSLNDEYVTEKKINTLRTHVDLEMGLAWGWYFNCREWHFDLSASYGYQVFFNQNMFLVQIAPLTENNLYIHGATAKARLDF